VSPAPGDLRARPFERLTAASAKAAGGYLGVYELAASENGPVVRVGFAGGRSSFGLAGELAAELERSGGELWFRCEVTMAYWSRYREVLMEHLRDEGRLPQGNEGEPLRLGRLGRRGPDGP
jgi:hypothetical protein